MSGYFDGGACGPFSFLQYPDGYRAGQPCIQGNGVFVKENVTLADGVNKIKSVGTCSGDSKKYEDSCEWTLTEEKADDNLAKDKTVYFSSEEGTGTDGSDTHATMAVDGVESTRWSALGKKNGFYDKMEQSLQTIHFRNVYTIINKSLG